MLQFPLETTRTLLEQKLSEHFKQSVLENKWIPHKPHPKQATFLLLNCREALYGGAAGGGKSDALLMAALQYVDVPRYSAIVFRRSFTDLALPGALMERSQEWLGGTEARYNQINHCWAFPSGATLAFGNLEHEQDKFRYQSAEFHYIGFDELTQFTETQYRYLFSRLRRLADSPIPLRMRAASNPGNVGHDWVKQRFMPWFKCESCGEQQQVSRAERIVECPKCQSLNVKTEPNESRIFIPAKLEDNPSLDREQYIASLSELDPITRRQYLDGDWTARHGGSIFLREWLKIVREPPINLKQVRFWDKASTEPKPQNKDPDWTVGVLLGTANGQYWVLDIKRARNAPPLTEQLIKQTAELDGKSTPIFMEQEPGSSGVDTISYYNRNVLVGFEFRGVKTSGPKIERAGPVSSAAEAGNMFVVQAPWNSAFLDEIEAFPDGAHDDQVDALSGAFSNVRGPMEVATSSPPW